MKGLELLLIGMLALVGIRHSVAQETSTKKAEGALVALKMEPEAMRKEVTDMKILLVHLTLFAGDHRGNLPSYLGELGSLEPKEADTVMHWNVDKKTSLPIFYIAGFTDSNWGNTVIIASPCVVNGKRVLGFLDGSVKAYKAEEGEKLLRDSMKREKGTALRKTLAKEKKE